MANCDNQVTTAITQGHLVHSRAWRSGMIRHLRDTVVWLQRRSSRRARRTIDARLVLEREAPAPAPYFHGSSKPYTRWWWLSGPFRREDIRDQLEWLRANGFGGVE